MNSCPSPSRKISTADPFLYKRQFTISIFIVFPFMHWQDVPSSVDIRRFDGPQLWLLAAVSFGLGDVVTTIIGFRMAGVYELNPIASSLFQYSSVGALLALKTGAFGIGYIVWVWTPRPQCLGAPLALITVGVPVTVWNLHTLLRVSLL